MSRSSRRLTDLGKRPPRFNVNVTWSDVKLAFLAGNVTMALIWIWSAHHGG